MDDSVRFYVLIQLHFSYMYHDGWMMDGLLAILRPFQQYFSHIRTMRG